MSKARLVHTAICALLLITSAPSIAAEPPCPMTNPKTFQVKVPWQNQHHPGADSIWFGSKSLAVLLAPDGIWTGMDRDQGFGNKLWFWSEDWNSREELRPELKVYARELNDKTLKSESTSATHGSAQDWTAMLTGLGFPASGCWEVSASYKESTVKFIVLVQDGID